MTPYEGTFRGTSPYGWRTLRGVPQRHNGQDLVGVTSKKQRAIWDCILVELVTGWNGGRGNTAYLYCNRALRALYQHVSQFLVEQNQKVKQGQYVAVEGNTGDSMGSHLHIEIQQLHGPRWVPVFPTPYTEVPNAAGTYRGNNNKDGTQEQPYKPVGATEVLCLGPMSQGDRAMMEAEAQKRGLGAAVQSTDMASGNVIELFGPMTAGDQKALESKAVYLKLPCAVYHGKLELLVGPMSSGDKNTIVTEARRLKLASAESQEPARKDWVVELAVSEGDRRTIEALAYGLALPVGVV